MLIFLESILMCFVLLIVCTIGLKNGPERFVVFYEKDVQERVVKLGRTDKHQIKRSSILSGLALFIPMLVIIPFMVYVVNDADGFTSAFWQISIIYWISGLFDRLFIDWFWVGHTKAWIIPGTEDLMPYIPKKTVIRKWLGTIVGYPIIALCIAGLVSLF